MGRRAGHPRQRPPTATTRYGQAQTVEDIEASSLHCDPSVRFLPPEQRDLPPRSCFLCRWFCCTCWCTRGREAEQMQGEGPPHGPLGPGPGGQRRMQPLPPGGQAPPQGHGYTNATGGPPTGSGRQLPEEVYRQIRAVENQTSTLTQKGITGFSARILDRTVTSHAQTGDIYIVQLVEIIKKPGQSLGLYLREGNGYDRPNGVFASRFGDNSELERYGDVIRPGDEILSINNVDVSSMSIDDVVLTLSIPRRLILKIRFNKNRRDRGVVSARSASEDRPVVVFHKVEERSCDDSSAPLLANPTPTANTWLGKKARQQEREMQQATLSRLSQPPSSSPSTVHPGGSMTMGRGASPRDHPIGTLHRELRDSLAVSPHGRGSPAQRQQLNGKPEGHVSELTRFSDPEGMDTVSRTARVHPPKIYPSAVRRAESFSSQPGMSTGGTGVQSPGFSMPRSSTTAYPPPDLLLSRSLCSPILPRPLRQTVSDHHSNSLPRRRAISGPRNVKWRNDVIGKETFDLLAGEESDGATSAPEYGGRFGHPAMRFSNGGPGRTINDIFSAAEYRHWAGVPPGEQPRVPPLGAAYANLTTAGYAGSPLGAGSPSLGYATSTLGRASRWSHTYGDTTMGTRGPRSASLTGRSIMAQSLVGSPLVDRRLPIERPSAVLDRYHISPLMNRRAPLRPAGPGINVDRLNVNSLSGMLCVQVYEGRGLRIPEKHRAVTEEMYCVLEVDEAHRARTGVATPETKYRWRETFHIDIFNATQLQFFVYSWHPQHRHSLCHKGSLKLLEAFIVDQLNGEKMFSLNLEPRGALLVKVGFHDLHQIFRRTVNPRADGVFGVPLGRLVQREEKETPTALFRLVCEIERRGTDTPGLYTLCGAVEKKRLVREDLEADVNATELHMDAVPDTNVLACLVKDLLRELPDPLIPPHIHNMLLDAAAVSNPNSMEENRQMVFRIIDCMSNANKSTLLLVMDHLSLVLSRGAPPRSMVVQMFAPLLLCTADGGVAIGASSKEPLVRPLDVSQAASTLQLLVDVWPSRVNSAGGSDSSSSGGGGPSSRPQPPRHRTQRSVSESKC